MNQSMRANTETCANQNMSQNAGTCANKNMTQNAGQRSSHMEHADQNMAASGVKIPNGCRAELMSFINDVSFAAYDALLYLDTHPDCQEALRYFLKYNSLREKALKIHAESYGPLTLASMKEAGCSSWEWMTQPWPWELEGGAC